MKLTKKDLGKTLFYEDKKRIKHPIFILPYHIGMTKKEAYLYERDMFRSYEE